MPGTNCSIYGCGTNRRHKGVSIFKTPSASEYVSMSKRDLEEWRSKFIGQILKDRVVDEALQKQIDAGTLRVCQKHFKEECIDSSEYTSQLNVIFFVGCQLDQSIQGHQPIFLSRLHIDLWLCL